MSATPESIAHTLANGHIFSEKFIGRCEAEQEVHLGLAGAEMEVRPTDRRSKPEPLISLPLAGRIYRSQGPLASRPASLNNTSYKGSVLEHLRAFAEKRFLRAMQ